MNLLLYENVVSPAINPRSSSSFHRAASASAHRARDEFVLGLEMPGCEFHDRLQRPHFADPFRGPSAIPTNLTHSESFV